MPGNESDEADGSSQETSPVQPQAEARDRNEIRLQSVKLYRLNRPTVQGRVRWGQFEALLIDAARLLNVPIPTAQVSGFHYLSAIPLGENEQETSTIVQQVNDIPDELILLDVEIHLPAVQGQFPRSPDVSRQVKRVVLHMFRQHILMLGQAPHVAIYRRPPWPAFSGDVYAIPDPDFHSQPPADLEEVQDDPTIPIALGQNDLPLWISQLHAVFTDQSRTDDAWERPIIEVLVWYLSGQTAESCRRPTVARLDNAHHTWRTSLVFACLDNLQRGLPIDIHVVHPSPPRERGHSHAAHVLVTQRIPSDLRAVVISTNPDLSREPRRQFAFVVPRRMSATDVRSAMMTSAQTQGPLTVWRGNFRFPENEIIDINTGDGLVIEPDDVTINAPLPSTTEVEPTAGIEALPETPLDMSIEEEQQANGSDASFLLQRHVQRVHAWQASNSLSQHVGCQQVDLSDCLESACEESPPRVAVDLNRALFDDGKDVDAPLNWSDMQELSVRESVAISIALPDRCKANLLVPITGDSAKITAAIQTAMNLFEPPSDLFPVHYRRISWDFSPHAWKVMSFQKPAHGMAVVLGIRFAKGSAHPHALMLPEHTEVQTLRQSLGIRNGSLVRLNGDIVHHGIKLRHGNVLEFHAGLISSKLPSFESKAVQISLEAVLPNSAPPFREDKPAWLLCEQASWNTNLMSQMDAKFEALPPGGS
eukprot:s332_g42.t1